MNFTVDNGEGEVRVSIYEILSELYDVENSYEAMNNKTGIALDIDLTKIVDMIKYFDIGRLVQHIADIGLLSDYGYNIGYKDIKVITKTRELGGLICIQKDNPSSIFDESNSHYFTIILEVTNSIKRGIVIDKIILNGKEIPLNTKSTINKLAIINRLL